MAPPVPVSTQRAGSPALRPRLGEFLRFQTMSLNQNWSKHWNVGSFTSFIWRFPVNHKWCYHVHNNNNIQRPQFFGSSSRAPWANWLRSSFHPLQLQEGPLCHAVLGLEGLTSQWLSVAVGCTTFLAVVVFIPTKSTNPKPPSPGSMPRNLTKPEGMSGRT